MERRLILMRHAKSDWSTDAPDDHSRPLNQRGRRDAPRMARWLAQAGWQPDAVVSSDACRTRQTWERMAPHLPQAKLRLEPGLYLGGLGALQESSARWPESWGTVLALGHNPGWERALAVLGGEALRLTTANCALLVGHGERWEQALEGAWTLHELARPREL